ncbi:uncharacterized protein AB675_7157 [Cyphellophora attinorum]|uniref:Uncharacterized protein n=1 Tax=Cyphellophora attinorum TaxID=1664694 RepID=A0A0N0NQ42_9EURO|nr:uncharacterized protein AB675_7157 [Phialophora attinorum]KPI43471.1 hypothetical protein AB675_7157 [Phialophora attinorum]
MAAAEDPLNTYTHLPIYLDPSTKTIHPQSPTSSSDPLLTTITRINDLHTSFKSLDTPNSVPPPPLPLNPKRTANINKLRESAAASARKGNNTEAARLLTFALDMAAGRPDWEPVGLKREELAVCYLARAGAHAEIGEWVDARRDAQCSVECKAGPTVTPQGQRVMGNPKAFLIAGKSLLEMGRTEEAVQWLERAIEVEGTQQEDCKFLVKMLEEAREKLTREEAA